jgi:hypothetical protein
MALRSSTRIFQAQVAANRAQFYYDVPAGPFYGYNRPGAKPSQGVIWNWWRQGMMGGPRRTTTASSPSLIRPDRALSRFCTAVGQVAQEQHIENLQGISARHAHDRAATINSDLLTFLNK